MKHFSFSAVHLFIVLSVCSLFINGAEAQVIVRHPVRFDESQPLNPALFGERASGEAPYLDLYKSTPRQVRGEKAETIEQTIMGTRQEPDLVEAFDGLGYGFTGPEGTARMRNPSDNTLAVGPDHIVQIVNSRMAVFTKKGSRFGQSGQVLYGPAETRNVFRGFGGACEKYNNGDAVARYDQLADRWLIVMPIFRKSAEGTWSMCYAVSKTPDPFGPWYRYEYLRDLFPDYPRPAVWPDGYYVTTSTGDNVIQKHAAVVERSRMLKGEEATEQMFVVDSVNFLINADLEGRQLPPAGAPNVMMAAGGTQLKKILTDDGVYYWKFHVDWKDPSQSKLTGPVKIPVAPYQYLGGGQLTKAIPQSGTDQRLDAQGDKLMARMLYRRIGKQESLVVVHSVATAAGGGGVRWYEFRLSRKGEVNLFQQGTYAPEGNYRWMASPAIDAQGNIGIGYSFSGEKHFPGQRFAGRLAGDPRGILSMKETVLVEGEAAQTGNLRWEDYTQTAIDPTDDMTIWYVGDYLKKDSKDYSTRIGAFHLGQAPEVKSERYIGKYIEGEGDTRYLRLIDESFAFFHPNPAVPNVSMLYQPDWDTFLESGGWNAWWIQNSYGFAYSATPFLQEPWFTVLQRSLDLLWNNQGDGKRQGSMDKPGKPANPHPLYRLVAPDGSLGDCAGPDDIIYKQGDGNVAIHDWFYEATAAGLVMQAEFLLAGRNPDAIAKYLPKMERACDFIEKARDPANNLFLVGPACNLLAPSYGGVRQPDGSFGKGYLAGVSVTYLAAIDRMLELYRMTRNREMITLFEHRQMITRKSLPLLTAPGGYFAKSVEPRGIMHGVLGQAQYGYLEGVVNADAVAMRVIDDQASQRIYNQIHDFPEIRPFDFLLTNAPGLDDTYWNWGNRTGPGMDGINEFGCWVNGGAWTTVEGRAILMYYRLGKFDDIYRSAVRALRWAKDFRMDQPLTQRGENTQNNWYDAGQWLHRDGVAVMADNFAVPAATIRGLFDYEYRSDRLILRPRIPGSVTRYTQKEPIRFGEKNIRITCYNHGKVIARVKINDKRVKIGNREQVELLYDQLPMDAEVEITTKGGWGEDDFSADYPVAPALVDGRPHQDFQPAALPDSMQQPYKELLKWEGKLSADPKATLILAMVRETMESFRVLPERMALDTGPGYYRAIDDKRKENMVRLYAQSAMGMYRGVANKMNKTGAAHD